MPIDAIGWTAPRRPLLITAISSHRKNISSKSSEITNTAQPVSLRFWISRRIKAAAATSTPQVGLAISSTRGFWIRARPTIYFCKLPPDKADADVCASLVTTSKRRMISSAKAVSFFVLMNPPLSESDGDMRLMSAFSLSDKSLTAARLWRSVGTRLKYRRRFVA